MTQTPRAGQDRERARQAFRLANDILNDLNVGAGLYRHLTNLEAKPHIQTAFRRLCLFHLVITLSKWCELYKRYKSIIPPGVTARAKALVSDIENRDIPEFRNKIVGHIWDDENKRPVSPDEVQKRLEKITGGDFEAFVAWVRVPESDSDVMAVVEAVRNELKAAHGLTDADLA